MAISDHRDLRGGNSPWERNLPVFPPATLNSGIRCDVLVVGAGATGALIAEAASARNLSTVIVDRRGAARGSTAANTALIEFELDTTLIELQDNLGAEKAGRVYLRTFAAVSGLLQKLERLGISCGQSSRAALYLCGDKLDPAGAAREAEERKKIGLPSEFHDARRLKERFGIDRVGGVVSEGSALLNPVEMVAGLIEAVLRRGGRLFEGEEVTEFSHEGERVSARTKNGGVIEAKHVVFAMGYELPRGMRYRGHKVVSTWALATGPQAKLWPEEVMITEAAEPYLYVRAWDGSRVIAGGEDESDSDAETRTARFSEKIAAIQQKLKVLLPHLDVKPKYAWTGAFGRSESGLPFIGRLEACPRCHVAAGFGGNGTTFAEVAAELIVADILGKPDPDAELFGLA